MQFLPAQPSADLFDLTQQYSPQRGAVGHVLRERLLLTDGLGLMVGDDRAVIDAMRQAVQVRAGIAEAQAQLFDAVLPQIADAMYACCAISWRCVGRRPRVDQ